MNTELNYPIKYAVLELTIEGGWSHNYEDITKGFIVSKCYVCESLTSFYKNGKEKTTFSVVFPYSSFDRFYYSGEFSLEEETPRYNACDKPYPVHHVSKVFDTYEEAKKEADICNLKFKKESTLRLYLLPDQTWNEVIGKFEKEYQSDILKCGEFEDLILSKLNCMSITDDNRSKKLTLISKK